MAVSQRVAKKRARYEAVVSLPPLPPDQHEALRSNIALHGVLVPILVNSDGPVRRVIDGTIRKAIADELGYACPEIVRSGMDEAEMRSLARALNLARRQLSTEQKRVLIADQLLETPERSNRMVAKTLGVHHATVASVRLELERGGQIIQCSKRVGRDGRIQPALKKSKSFGGEDGRLGAAIQIQGDCRDELPKLAAESIDLILTDPPYPEIDRDYGRLTEAEWHDLMRFVVGECRRVLKPTGSAVFILQPNSRTVGEMRLWMWEFLIWAAKEWNLVQDAYSWTVDALPVCGANRKIGLMRPSVKMCVWLGPKDCYRNQEAVLRSPSEKTSSRKFDDLDERKRRTHRYRNGAMATAAAERGGTTPFNLLPISNGGSYAGQEDHQASTSQELASWWCRYLLPPQGTLLDCFSGTGTILSAGLELGARQVIGIERTREKSGIASP